MKIDKVLIERDFNKKSKGIAWVTSEDKPTLKNLLKLHNRVIYYIILVFTFNSFSDI